MLWLVEARRTLEWGGYYEAETEDDAKRAAILEMSFDTSNILDEQIICTPKDPET